MSNVTQTEDQFFSIIYGDGPDAVDIGQLVDGITNITRNVGSGWNHTYSTGTGRYGQAWTAGNLSSKTIQVDFTIYGDQARMMRFRRDLAAALDCPDGPKKLSFNDQPNTYYLAVTNGTPSLKEDINEGRATGTIEFVVPDGLLHSSVSKLLTSRTTNESIGSITSDPGTNIVTAKINNQGTVDCYPKIRVKSTSDNGWLGIVHRNGILEIGSKSATSNGDRVYSGATASDVLLNISPSTRTSWDANFTKDTGPISNRIRDYAAHSEVGDNNFGVVQKGIGGRGYPCPGYALVGTRRPTAVQYAMSTYVHNLRTDVNNQRGAKNWRCDFNVKLWQSVYGQTGTIGLLFLDDSNNLICAWCVEKFDERGEETYMNFTGGNLHDDTTGGFVRERRKFGANNNEKGQPNPNVAFNSSKGDVYIIKQDGQFTFSYNGTPYTVNYPSKANMVCTKIALIGGVYMWGQPLDTLVIQSIKFTKTNVDRYDYTPNRYGTGSTVEVDLYQGKIRYISDSEASRVGVSGQSDLVHGSEFFSVPKGISEIKINSSSFVRSAPEVEIEWNESWL